LFVFKYLFYFIIFIIIYKYDTTALMIASEKKNFEIVKLLIENNADVNIQDKVFF
jgi:ankyrin repeat protein